MLLDTRRISKSYHTKTVLTDVNLCVDAGEIHGLVGKNGAGKSTFVNIITGLVRDYQGDVIFEGRNINRESVLNRQRAGIFLVPQHSTIVDEFSIAENIFIGVWPKRNGCVDRKYMEKKTRELLRIYGLDKDPALKAGRLNLVEQRKLNIIRAIFSNAKLIILDEPTTSLTREERDNLFQFVRDLRAKGVSFIFISHYLDEILRICDKITVFKDGRSDSASIGETSEQALSGMIVGENVDLFIRKKIPRRSDACGVRCEGLAARNLNGLTLNLPKGRITGFVGFPGSGARESLRVLGGIEPHARGKIFDGSGREIAIGCSSDAIESGFMYVSYDRHSEGLVPDMSILHNISMCVLKGKLANRLGYISDRGERDNTMAYYRRLEIKARNEDELTRTLSGGNQQKVVIAKALCADPAVLLLDEPTIGIDIGSREEIMSLISALADEGLAIAYHTSDYSEMLRICDELCFFSDGELKKTMINEDLTVEQIAEIRDALGRKGHEAR